MNEISKLLILFGIILIFTGLIFSGKFNSLGKLPGDIFIQKENFTFYFPITTMILISLIISLIFVIFK
ncbi:MAG: DUF2905 domain-containing protein [bacterium]|nr:DUF2905 domain-containing protein [Patescibacteria group bacterium]MDW8280010.1 DUF2905 domain-containing protein [bacterium]